MTTYNFLINTGTVTLDTASLQTDVNNEFKAALGSNINLASSTPQGTLASAEATARAYVMKNNSDLANTFNPDLSYGVYLDAICALLGISRGVNTSTNTTLVLLSNTSSSAISVPNGARVQTAAGDIFTIGGSSPIAIAASSTATCSIVSQAAGPIPCAVGSLTILDGVLGWATAAVQSSSVVTLGTLALSDNQLKIWRRQRLAAQGVGSSAAIRAAVLAVPNVTSVNVVENNTGATGVVNGINFTLPNAMWVCVNGGTQAAVAAALYNAHSGGCPWDFGASGNGNPVNSPNGVSVIDPSTGLTYNVKSTTPILYDAYCQISVHQSGTAASPINAVQNAITQYTSGQESGEPGLVIGANVSAFEYAGAVARQIPGMYVKSCSIAVVPAGSAPPSGGAYTTEYVMPPYGMANQTAGNIAVTIV